MTIATGQGHLEERRRAGASVRPGTLDSRADILSAAAECFREQGFSATSIDDVARRLSATKGMIYHHFRSKVDLFFAVYRRGMEINFEAVEPHSRSQDTALVRLSKMAMAHAIVMMSEQAFQRVLIQGVAMHQQGATTADQRTTLAELIDIRNRYEALFRKAIEEAADECDLVLSDPSVASKSFLAVLNSSVYWYSPRDDDPQSEQISLARELVKYALRGFGADLPSDELMGNGTTK